MVLAKYLLMLVWLFAGGALLTKAFDRETVTEGGKSVTRWKLLPAIMLVVPFILFAAFRTNFGDTYLYTKIFSEAPGSLLSIPEYLASHTKDKGFSVLMIVFKAIFGNSTILFFFLVAAFQMICLALVYRKYSVNYWMSIFLFVASTDYLSWVQNGMRQFIAVAAVFACFGLMLRKKYVHVIIVILLASLIHGSALLMIPIIFVIRGKALNRKTLFLIAATAVLLLLFDRFTPLMDMLLSETQYSDITSDRLMSSDDGTSLIRVIVYAIPALLAWIGRKRIEAADDPVVNICVNCSLVTVCLYAVSAVSSGIYIGRLPIYTSLMSYILLPWLIENIFTEDSIRLVNSTTVVCYLAFFYYQMHVGWGVF